MATVGEWLRGESGDQRDQELADWLRPSVQQNNLNWFQGFAGSALWAVPGMVGIEPPREIRNWQAEHPWGSFGAEVVGTLPVYGGALKYAERIPGMARALEGVTSAERPIASAAARDVLKIAPLEAGRLAGAAAFGDPGQFGNVATSAVTDLALFGAVGGLGKALTETAPAIPRDAPDMAIARIFKEYDPSAPAQERLRSAGALRQGLEAADPNAVLLAQREAQLSRDIRTASAPTVRSAETGEELPQFVRNLTDTGGAPVESDAMNALFRSPNAKRFIAGTETFPDEAAWRGFAAEAGLPAGWERDVQFPRALQFGSDAAAAKAGSTIERLMAPVGDGWYLAKEADGGLYVMAHRLGDLEGPLTKESKFVLFKTGAPDVFRPELAKWTAGIQNRAAWEASASLTQDAMAEKLGLRYYAAAKALADVVPYEGARIISQGASEGSIADRVGALAQKLGIADRTQEGVQAALGLGRTLKEYIAPAAFQFSDVPQAKYAFGTAKLMFDLADANAKLAMFGEAGLRDANNLVRSLIQSPTFEGGFKPLLEALGPEDRASVTLVRNRALSIPQAAEEGILTPKAQALLEKLDATFGPIAKEIESTQTLTGQRSFQALENHYGLSHQWEGDWRAPLVDEGGRLLEVAAGRSAGAAEREAAAAIAEADAAGIKLFRSDKWSPGSGKTLFRADQADDWELSRAMRTTSPEFKRVEQVMERVRKAPTDPLTFQHRTDVGGYAGQKEPLSTKQLEEHIFGNLQRYHKYLAESQARLIWNQQLQGLPQYAPRMLPQLEARLAAMAGKQGPIAQAINRGVDAILGPVLGKNSASKITSTMASYMNVAQFGFFNLTHGATNLLTFVQTALPELYAVMNATERMRPYYMWLPAAGADGRIRGGMGMLDIQKLAYRAMQEMGKPGEDLKLAFSRAFRDGTIDPRFNDEFVGANAKQVAELRSAWGKPDGVVQGIGAVAKFLPNVTEKFSRGHTFTMAWQLGRDIMELDPERAYWFAKEATNRSMYLYSTADRARVMTGPLGQAWGLFKNWSWNYIGNMAVYAGAGIKHNQWGPLVWSLAGTGAVGGVAGVPGYFLANQISQAINDKSLFLNLYEAWGGDRTGTYRPAEDMMFFGLPAFLGVSLQASASAPGADALRDAGQLFSFAAWERGKALGKAIGSAVESWSATGRNPFTDDRVRDAMIRAVGPRAIYRAFAVMEDSALRSMSTGYPLVADLSLNERLAYGLLGLNPTRVEKEFRVGDELWKKQAERKAAISRMGLAWAEAQDRGDADTLTDLSVAATARKLDLGSIVHSAQSYSQKMQRDALHRHFRPQDLEAYLAVLGQPTTTPVQ